MKRLVLAAALLCSTGGFAQSRVDEYGYPEVEADELAPEVLTDTALFYNTARKADDLYDKAAGYRLSFVQNRRRNVGYRQGAALYEGARLPVDYARLLRALGAGHAQSSAADAAAAGYGASVGAESYTFGPAEDAAGSVGAAYSTRGYSAGVRAAVAAALGRGWSLSAAVDARTGRDMHVDGVFLNSAGAAVRIAKHFAGGGELSLFAAAEPSERGLRSASAAEAFALTGNNLYNPSWGWQNGRQRNSRVRREAVPAVVAAFAQPAGESTTVTAMVAARFGVRRQSGLGWYDASTPMPDNYRYMPGYFSGISAEAVEAAWRAGDARYTQINWEEMYIQNRMSDRGVVYALDDRVRRITDLQASVGARTSLGGGVTIRYGADVRYAAERRYKEMLDLMDAPFITDIDYFLIDDDSFANSLQNDLRNPDRMVREGDRFGYDYALVDRSAAIHAAADYASGRFDLHVAARIGGHISNRHGYFEKELFAGSGSFGDSEKMRFATYAAAAEFGWTFTPQYRIGVSLRASAEAPDTENLFLNPQYNNSTVADVSPLRRLGAEITARAVTESVQMQAALFAESQRDGINTMQYYDDLAGEFCDMSASGIDILAYGIEAAATIRPARRWHIDAAVTAMQCRYTSDPTVRVWTDRANVVIDAGSASHMGDCTPGGVPRLAAALAVGYRSFSGWSATISGAWAGARSAEPSLLRRTERVAYQGASSPEAFDAIVLQERLPDAFNVDLHISKRWFVGRTSRITAAVAVHNLLGERGNISSAYESHRVRRVSRGIQSDYIPLPTRYLYAYPRTVMLTATYTF